MTLTECCYLVKNEKLFDKGQKMQRRQVQFLIIAIILVVIIAAFYHYEEEKKHSDHLILYGNVDVRIVNLGFRVPGKLQKLYFEEGDIVKPGDLMAELDATPYEATLKEAQERVNSLISSFKNTNTLFKRREKLIGSNSISKQEYEDALYGRDSSQANLNEAEAARTYAQIQLDDTKIISLQNGTVLTRVREPGTILTAGDPVYVVSISTPVWIRTYVNEPNLGFIRPGMEAEVYTDTKINGVYKGRVGFISSVAEFTPKNVETTDLRTDLVYRLRIYIEEPTEGLLQGMPVTVKLRIK